MTLYKVGSYAVLVESGNIVDYELVDITLNKLSYVPKKDKEFSGYAYKMICLGHKVKDVTPKKYKTNENN